LKRIWGFGGGFDRFYPSPGEPPFWTSDPDFVPAGIGILSGLCVRNRSEHLFRARIISAVKARRSQSRRSKQKVETEVRVMLSWVVTFLVIALIAGILGFGGIAGASIEIAKVIFFIAVVLFLISAVVGLARGRTRV
jgi:uncharacterized membrane protein YtjA (UPF0391 family)